jgi:hypothetical protein
MKKKAYVINVTVVGMAARLQTPERGHFAVYSLDCKVGLFALGGL